jgi:hypothetical protein
MTRNREIYIGEDNGEKVYYLIEYKENSVTLDLFTIKSSVLTREKLDQLYNQWLRDGERVPLPNHDHIVWDLNSSTTMPIYVGIKRPEDRDRLDNNAKKRIHDHHSKLYSGILSSEIKTLKANVLSLRVSSSNDDLNLYSKKANEIKTKIKEGKEREGNIMYSSKQIITPRDAYSLFEELNIIFSKLNELKDEKSSSSEKYIVEKLEKLESDFRYSDNLKEIRENLKILQKELSQAYMQKEKKNNLFERLNKLFESLNKKQTSQKEEYEKETTKNYDIVSSQITSVKQIVSETKEWSETRNTLKSIQECLKKLKFKKEQREKLWSDLNDLFTTLGNRQEKANLEYKKACETSMTKINDYINRCSSLSYDSDDWSEARNYLKETQNVIKTSTLNKETRQRYFEKLKECFGRLNNRQNEVRNRYDEETYQNYCTLETQLKRCAERVSYGDDEDLKYIRGELLSIQQNVKAVSLKKDHRNELFESINFYFEKLKKRQDKFYERINTQRYNKKMEILSILRQKAERLEDSINHDQSILSDKQSKYYNVRPGPKEYEIKQSLSNSMNSLGEKISSKQDSLYEIKAKIRDIESSL